MIYIIPALLLVTFTIAFVKKVSIFDSFLEGSREALKLVANLIPYLGAMFVAIEIMRLAGISDMLARLLAPVFGVFGVPVEIAELVILRPLSGSGSLAVLQSIYNDHGVDSYAARVASVLMGSTDTILYVVAIYFSTSKDKKSGAAIPIALVSSLIGVIAASFICRIL